MHSLLGEVLPSFPEGKLKELETTIAREQRQLSISASRRIALEQEVESYAKGAKSYDLSQDMRERGVSNKLPTRSVRNPAFWQ